MVHAIVLLEVERDKINAVAEQLVDMKGISEVYSVAGRYDLAVMVRVNNNDELAEAITSKLLKVPGISRSETLISFRVHSRYELERIFSVGME